MPYDYYSENWYQATEKFIKNKSADYDLNWVCAPGHDFDIPYVQIGRGPHKIVVNSGVHGLEGFFGSAAQVMFLREFAPKLTSKILDKYTIGLIHVINGWGMQNRMREVLDHNGGLVDLNRNFGIDFSQKASLPLNSLYEKSHDLLVSKPDAVNKKNAIKNFYYSHRNDGAWDAISRGQYVHPDGLFYGGDAPAIENKMTMSAYDAITRDAESLVSVGLHTGLGHFNRRTGYVSMNLLVSHPFYDFHSQWFNKNFGWAVQLQCGNSLLGDLVDCLEARYESKFPVYTADLEIGTGEYPIMSPIYKRMDMGDARYDLAHGGKINPQTWRNLTESWYPSHPAWRAGAMKNARIFWNTMIDSLGR